MNYTMFDYRWVKILESLYDNGSKLSREELLKTMHQRGVKMDASKLDEDLFVLEDEGLVQKALAGGVLTLTQLGARKVKVVRRGY
jgi:repressor of nif and glnA expression